MNKMTKIGTLICATCAVVFTAVAAEPKVQPTIEETLIAKAADVASGKVEYLGGITLDWKPELATNAVRSAKLAKEIDDILCKSDLVLNVYGHKQADLVPKTYAKYLASVESEYPLTVKIIRGEATPPQKSAKNYIKYIIEHELFEISQPNSPNTACGAGKISGIARDIQDSSVYAVRRGLRKAGKSFVAKPKLDENGKAMKDAKGNVIMTNPTKEYMDEITACLNAPYFNGLEAALKKVGVEDENLPKLDDLRAKADEVVNALEEKVLDGEIGFSNSFAYYLRFKLGVVEYNKFVKLYNDGI